MSRSVPICMSAHYFVYCTVSTVLALDRGVQESGIYGTVIRAINETRVSERDCKTRRG